MIERQCFMSNIAMSVSAIMQRSRCPRMKDMVSALLSLPRRSSVTVDTQDRSPIPVHGPSLHLAIKDLLKQITEKEVLNALRPRNHDIDRLLCFKKPREGEAALSDDPLLAMVDLRSEPPEMLLDETEGDESEDLLEELDDLEKDDGLLAYDPIPYGDDQDGFGVFHDIFLDEKSILSMLDEEPVAARHSDDNCATVKMLLDEQEVPSASSDPSVAGFRSMSPTTHELSELSDDGMNEDLFADDEEPVAVYFSSQSTYDELLDDPQ